MNTEIKKIKGSWEEVVDDCRATVGKPPLGHEPSEDFKRRILIAELGRSARSRSSGCGTGSRAGNQALCGQKGIEKLL